MSILFLLRTAYLLTYLLTYLQSSRDYLVTVVRLQGVVL